MDSFGVYRLSGKAGFGSLLGTLVLGGFLAILIGFAYGYLVHVIGYVKVGIALSMLAAALTGGVVFGLAFKLRIRSLLLTTLIGFACGVVFTWAVWVGWIFSLSEREVLLLNPFYLFLSAISLGVEGVYTIGSDTPKGAFLYFLWVTQALSFLGIITIMPPAILSGKIYSEQTGRWLEQTDDFPLMDVPGESFALKRDLEAGSFSTLLSLPFSTHLVPVCLSLQVFHGGDPEDLHVLRVQKTVVNIDKKGRIDMGKTNLVKGVIVPRAVVEELREKVVAFQAELDRLEEEETHRMQEEEIRRVQGEEEALRKQQEEENRARANPIIDG